jgi:hypothetical protein
MRDYLKKKNPGSYDAYTLEKDIYPILKYLGIGQGHPNFPICSNSPPRRSGSWKNIHPLRPGVTVRADTLDALLFGG